MKALLLMGILAITAIWIWRENRTVKVTELSVKQKRLPQAFSGFRIAQISDLHGAQFGENNAELLKLVRNARPHIIVMTGDLMDAQKRDFGKALDFARKAAAIAPCYYVPGNHEGRSPAYPGLETELRNGGIYVLRDEKTTISAGEEKLTLLGLDDQEFDIQRVGLANAPASFNRRLEGLTETAVGYKIMLCHRPEKLAVYGKAGVDLVFCGHAHGGQVRIPGIGGLYAPEQGLFPRYTSGIHCCEDTTMVVSRGLSIRLFPFRVNNPPELVVVQLECDQDSAAI